MPGELTFSLSCSDAIAANRANLLAAWRRPRTYRGWLILIVAAGGLGAAIAGWFRDRTFLPWLAGGYALLALAAVPLVHLLSYAMVLPYRTRRLYRQQRAVALPQHWRWTAGELHVRNAHGDMRLPWDVPFGWRESRAALLLFLNERSYYAVPRHAADPMVWDDLVATIRASGLTVY